jgi:hypothetical protein
MPEYITIIVMHAWQEQLKDGNELLKNRHQKIHVALYISQHGDIACLVVWASCAPVAPDI